MDDTLNSRCLKFIEIYIKERACQDDGPSAVFEHLLRCLPEYLSVVTDLTNDPVYLAHMFICFLVKKEHSQILKACFSKLVQTHFSPSVTQTDQLGHAITVAEQAALATGPAKMLHLLHICRFHSHNFQRSGRIGNLQCAITAGKQALAAAVNADVPIGMYARYAILELMVNLVPLLGPGMKPEDFDLMVDLQNEMTKPGYETCVLVGAFGRAENLYELACMLMQRYDGYSHEIVEVQRAVELSLEAANIAGNLGNMECQAAWLASTADWMRTLAKKTGERKYLNQGLDLARRAFAITPPLPNITPANGYRYDGPQFRAAMVVNTNLSNVLIEMATFGDLQYLNEAIKIKTNLVNHCPPGHPDYPLLQINLSTCLVLHYQKTRISEDIENAIRYAQESVNETRKRDKRPPMLAQRLFNLARAYAYKYANGSREEGRPVLLEGIKISQEARLLHPDNLDIANIYAMLIAFRYDDPQGGRLVQELDGAIEMLHLALDKLPEGRSLVSRRDAINTLCGLYDMRFTYQSAPSIILDSHRIDDVIQLMAANIKLGGETGSAGSNRSGMLFQLSNILLHRYRLQGNVNDRMEALEALRGALEAKTSPASHRVNAILRALPDLALYTAGDSLEQYKLLSEAVRILPSVATRAQDQKDQQKVLFMGYGALPSRAAVAAIQAGQPDQEALALVEIGRGVLFDLQMSLRRDLTQLEHEYPEPTARLIQCRTRLRHLTEAANNLPHKLLVHPNTSTAIDRDEAEEDLERSIHNIQKLPGWQHFLQPPVVDDFMRAAKLSQSTIIVINVTEIFCTAFIVKPSEVRLLALPELKEEDIKSHIKSLGSQLQGPRMSLKTTLEWLWDTIVKRVLGEGLGVFTACTGADMKSWPRVCWVPTGRLSAFPIHAAGYHYNSTGQTALDRVVSTYSPSIKALLSIVDRQPTTGAGNPQQHNRTAATQAPQRRAVLVAVDKSEDPSLQALPNAAIEVNALKDVLGSPPAALLGIEVASFQCPTKEDVLHSLASTSIIHFAGHGEANPQDPSESALYLREGLSNPLTVANIISATGMDSANHNQPLFAYLSACKTGKLDADLLAEEGIHLMSACLIAGFRHVVGSLWSVSDPCCVRVAKDVYDTLLGHKLDDMAFAWALHCGIRKLRHSLAGSGIYRSPSLYANTTPDVLEDQNSIGFGTREVRPILDDTEKAYIIERALDLWTPFIHMGP